MTPKPNIFIHLIAAIIYVATASAAPPIAMLPPEPAMQAFVVEILATTGLKNEVSVVIDRGAPGCAYATTSEGRQFIGVDPACVGPLKVHGVYRYRATGILAHEIGHLLSGHTTNQKLDNPDEESAADEWSGWAMYRFGATLEQAQTFARSMSVNASATHPGRQVRLQSVATGWNKAKDGTPMPSRSQATNWWAQLMATPLPWVSQVAGRASK